MVYAASITLDVGVRHIWEKRMDYSEFVFSQLFMLLLQRATAELTYDQIHPDLVQVWQHWLLTDALYGRPDQESEYAAMERYIKEHADGIKHLLTK